MTRHGIRIIIHNHTVDLVLVSRILSHNMGKLHSYKLCAGDFGTLSENIVVQSTGVTNPVILLGSEFDFSLFSSKIRIFIEKYSSAHSFQLYIPEDSPITSYFVLHLVSVSDLNRCLCHKASWDADQALHMRRTEGNIWTASTSLPYEKFEFKVALKLANGRVHWQVSVCITQRVRILDSSLNDTVTSA